MSLDFNVERMKNYNVLTTLVEPSASRGEAHRKWHPVTEALVFATMAIGMNSITEKNWKEFYQRLNMWERSVRPQLWRGEIPVDDKRNYITPLEVYMHIGLHTNASSKTETQFLKDCFKSRQEDNLHSFKDVGVDYLGLSLDDISEDDWQKAWRLEGDMTRNTDSLVTALRALQLEVPA